MSIASQHENLHPALSSARKELLARRLKTALERVAGESSLARSAIAPGDWCDTAPLSYGQERIWFVQQLIPESPVYNTPVLIRLHGVLDRRALGKALNRIVSRHVVLRSRYTSEKGSPVQQIASEMVVELRYEDLSGLPDPESEVQRLAVQEAWRPFDLEQGTLKSATLLSLAKNEHVLLLALHHIAFDAWSGAVFCRELALFYSAELAGIPSPLPDLRVQYPDFAIWQRNQDHIEKLEQQVTYWKSQLADLPAVIKLPGELPPVNERSYRGAIHLSNLRGVLLNNLETLAEGQGATLFMLLAAAFQALLYRYTGQTDLVLGTPIAGRNLVEVEELIGVFVNTLLIRTRLAGDLTFRQLLVQVRKNALEAFANQDLPFERLVQELRPQRDLSRTPFFRFFINSRNVPQIQMPAGDLRIERMDFNPQTALFDLSLEINVLPGGAGSGLETPDDRLLRWVYATEIFPAGLIERIAEDYLCLLNAIAANADLSLDELPLAVSAEGASPTASLVPALTPEQRRQILVEWNQTQVEFPRESTVFNLFEEQVSRTPDALALVSDQPLASVTTWLRQWVENYGDLPGLTYAALNRCANQLAHKLRKIGVGPDILVGIHLEHSLETVVSIWSVIKAGGAYLPLDPGYPVERVKYMLKDAQIAALISRQAEIEKLGLDFQDGRVLLTDADPLQVVILDQPDSDLDQESTTNPPAIVSPENLAYVIYTSGSTGRPKGVGIPHSALVNHTIWMQSVLKLDPSDKVFLKTPFSFDASVWEYISPLSYGAGLVVARPQGQRDPQYLAAAIRLHGITVLQLVPTQLRLLLAEGSFHQCGSLRYILCGGEALSPELVRRTKAALPVPLIINLYGPSEACIDSACWICPPDADVETVPIGRPVSNVLLHILDHNLQPVPVGVAGELYVGGAGLGVGYINRPELNQQKFIANPILETASRSERLYRTGDLARYLPDGNIEFLGRVDEQVKLRGFRIELGEIEVALSGYPDIQQAAVVVRTLHMHDAPENQVLAAYIVVRPGCVKPAVQELRGYLKERLPEYMLPVQFVFLDVMPLTPSNKIDRRALIAIDEVEDAPDQLAQLPRDDIERKLAQIWARVLNCSRVGTGDNFFALGGHSLLAMQLLAHIADEFGANLPVRVVFDAPTLAAMTDMVRVFLRPTGAGVENDLVQPSHKRESGEL